MHLRKLTIQNIASIENAVIDFDIAPLSDSEVFLITGRTGAGKSTILDAICLALYGDTPRLHNSSMQGESDDTGVGKGVKLKDPRNMLRRNCGECKAELEFVGNDGHEYIASWGVARARKKLDGKLQNKTWKFSRKDGKTILTKDSDIKAAVAEAIGLDFDQFCRTTMLAQGDFTRFLDSRDEEKAAILEKITGTTVYSRLGAKVFELTRARQQAYEKACQGVEGIHLLSPQETEAITGRIKALSDHASEIDKLRAAVRRKLEWYRSLQTLGMQRERAMNRLSEVRGALQSDEVRQLETALSQLSETVDVRRVMGSREELRREDRRHLEALDDLSEHYRRLLASLAAHQRQIEEIEHQARQYEETAQSLAEAEKRLEGYGLSSLRKERDKELAKKTDAFTAYERMKNYLEGKKRREEAAEHLEKLSSELASDMDALPLLQQRLAEAEKNRNNLAAVHDRQRMAVDDFTSSLRARLSPGDTCPVCGGTVSSMPDESALRELFRHTEEAAREAASAFDKASAALAETRGRIQSLSRQVKEEQTRQKTDGSFTKANSEAVMACRKMGVNPLAGDVLEKLASLAEERDAKMKEIDSRLAGGEECEKEVKKLRQRTDRLRNVANEANVGRTTLDMERQALLDIASAMPDWKDLTAAGKGSTEILMPRIQNLAGRVQAQLEQRRATLSRIEELDREISAYFESENAVTQVRMDYLVSLGDDKVREIQAELKRLADEDLSARSALESVERQITELNAVKPEMGEDETPDLLEQKERDCDFTIASLGEDIGALNQQLIADAERRNDMSKLMKRTEKLRLEWLRWQRLNELVGDATGSKFRRIAQSYVLENLISSANVYMHALSGRYTLEVIPGTFVISIADAYQGYARRAASTISGGESFLVSLALALALSDMGSRLAVDTLFIDEGFGTLSGDALRQAVETLRGLHSRSGRHVGIISHVEELRERIGSQIRLVQSPGSSSSRVEVV